ncbi:hypothetical protein Y032_0126g1326 [Ancylostoma ceylanicum]|uniref:Uncharacterized protein n=1 Tax=Ancylostoma ceylanicum TaxID=53326 RepID=A0A016T8J4_9BILA|nr:hypothetical protein Y032_0126g1326 [Ancylostoma ceylanicum]
MGRSDGEPEPHSSPSIAYFEEKCKKNSARIAILEEEVLELRRAVEAQMKKKIETKDEACDAMAPDDSNDKMGNALEKENVPRIQPARPPLGPIRYGCHSVNASRKPTPYTAVIYCHFCGQRGFSDSCRNILSSAQSAEIVISKGLCPKCLKRPTSSCRKTFPSPYCGQSGHHNSLCSSVAAYEERA